MAHSLKLRRSRAFLSGSALLAVMLTSAPAFAQDALDQVTYADAGPGDIIVTARKREERLQDVPIAITAVSSEAIESRGMSSVTDMQQVSPNLNFTPGQGGNSGGISAFIRGVGENEFIITSDPAVALYIDGVYVGRSFGATTELLGVDRIEVLRGPQGSLFGKNTIGGAISVVSRLPGSVQRIEGDVRYGSYNTVRVRGNVETPLSENFAIGVSALGEWGEGWQKIPSGKNLGNRDVQAGRIALRYHGKPVEAVLSVDALRRRQNSAAHSMLAFTPTFLSDLQSALIAPCCTVPGKINRTDSSDELNRDDTDAVNTTLILTADVGAGTLKSISSYRWVSATFGRDGDASSTVNYAGDIHDETARQFSQELQYATSLGDRANLLVGAYFFREKSKDDTRLYVADGLYPAMIAAGFDPMMAEQLDLNIDFFNRQKTTNYALFGNFTYDLTDALSVELGGRYTWEKKTFDQTAMRIYSQQPLLAGTPSYRLKEDWKSFTPRVSVGYKFQPDLLGYASWSRGFRSGGFNGRPTALEEIGSYDPEKLTAYEVGLKSRFGNVAMINLSLFRNDYKDQQLLISTVSPNSGLIVVRTENAGKSRIQGVELEGDFRVSSAFRLTGSLGYLHAKYLRYSSVIAGVETDVSYRKPRQAPEITASGSAIYTIATSDRTDATFRVDANYRTKTYIDVENTEMLAAPDHVILNASADFQLPVDGLSLRLAVDNLTNKRVITAGYDATGSFGFVEAYFNSPRRYWATLTFRR